jgi:DNA-binding MarR family transcriptional regulator
MHIYGTDGEQANLTVEEAIGAAIEASYDDRPSALIICDGTDGQKTLEHIAKAAGARLLGTVDIAGAAERLDRIAAVRLLIVKADSDSPALAALLARIDRIAETEGTAIIVAVMPAVLDLAFGLLTTPLAQLLCAPSDTDFAAALALALHNVQPTALHDIGRESEALRLQRLSEEVSRIARTLASLSGGISSTPSALSSGMGNLAAPEHGYVGEPPSDASNRPRALITPREIRDMLRLRRLRDQFFAGELFADPAWDMLLDLMAAHLSGQRVSVSSLCIAAAVPATTALRWIRALTDNGIFLRQADPADGRRVFIALSAKAAEAMNNFFSAAKRTKAMIA